VDTCLDGLLLSGSLDTIREKMVDALRDSESPSEIELLSRAIDLAFDEKVGLEVRSFESFEADFDSLNRPDRLILIDVNNRAAGEQQAEIYGVELLFRLSAGKPKARAAFVSLYPNIARHIDERRKRSRSDLDKFRAWVKIAGIPFVSKDPPEEAIAEIRNLLQDVVPLKSFATEIAEFVVHNPEAHWDLSRIRESKVPLAEHFADAESFKALYYWKASDEMIVPGQYRILPQELRRHLSIGGFSLDTTQIGDGGIFLPTQPGVVFLEGLMSLLASIQSHNLEHGGGVLENVLRRQSGRLRLCVPFPGRGAMALQRRMLGTTDGDVAGRLRSLICGCSEELMRLARFDKTAPPWGRHPSFPGGSMRTPLLTVWPDFCDTDSTNRSWLELVWPVSL